MASINSTARRSPAQLRDVLEVRVRRQAETYSRAARRQSLVEIEQLARHAIQHIDQEIAAEGE
jgi:hypothetical protein